MNRNELRFAASIDVGDERQTPATLARAIDDALAAQREAALAFAAASGLDLVVEAHPMTWTTTDRPHVFDVVQKAFTLAGDAPDPPAGPWVRHFTSRPPSDTRKRADVAHGDGNRPVAPPGSTPFDPQPPTEGKEPQNRGAGGVSGAPSLCQGVGGSAASGDHSRQRLGSPAATIAAIEGVQLSAEDLAALARAGPGRLVHFPGSRIDFLATPPATPALVVFLYLLARDAPVGTCGQAEGWAKAAAEADLAVQFSNPTIEAWARGLADQLGDADRDRADRDTWRTMARSIEGDGKSPLSRTEDQPPVPPDALCATDEGGSGE